MDNRKHGSLQFWEKDHVFRLDLKESREDFCRRRRESSLHADGPKTEKAREPTVESLVRGIWRLRDLLHSYSLMVGAWYPWTGALGPSVTPLGGSEGTTEIMWLGDSGSGCRMWFPDPMDSTLVVEGTSFVLTGHVMVSQHVLPDAGVRVHSAGMLV